MLHMSRFTEKVLRKFGTHLLWLDPATLEHFAPELGCRKWWAHGAVSTTPTQKNEKMIVEKILYPSAIKGANGKSPANGGAHGKSSSANE